MGINFTLDSLTQLSFVGLECFQIILYPDSYNINNQESETK